MQMAEYIYRNFPTGFVAYSFDTQPFVSYPMYRPAKFNVKRLAGEASLQSLLAENPAYVLSNLPTLPEGSVPGDARATMLYSEFVPAQFGYAALGTRYIRAFENFRARDTLFKFPSLAWVTLYRVERAKAARS
jgi:hypothetical protein